MIKLSEILNPLGIQVTQEFGVPWVRNLEEIHNGIDLNPAKFTPIRVPVDGIVTRANYHFIDPIHALGNRVSIYFKVAGRSLELYFCHLDGINRALQTSLSDGGYPRVKSGDIAGWVGSTGSCVGKDGGIHLHLGVRDYETGEWLNPRDYIDFAT